MRFLDHVVDVFDSVFSDDFHCEVDAAYSSAMATMSVIDIAIAKFVGGIHWHGVFKIIQNIKSLSFEKYEGSSVKTGLLVFDGRGDFDYSRYGAEFISFSGLESKGIVLNDAVMRDAAFYRYVDGYDSCYACDVNGVVKGYYNIDASIMNSFDKITGQRVLSILEGERDALFYIGINAFSDVEIFKSNKSRIVYRRGKWRIFDCSVIDKAVCGSAYDVEPWKCFYSLSKIRKGSVVLFTDRFDQIENEGFVKKHIDSGSGVFEAIRRSVKMCGIRVVADSGELLRILTTDGMVVFSSDFSQVLDINAIVDTSKAPTDEVGGGGRSTAAAAASKYGVAVKVSEDGPVSIYREGRCIYKVG
ncbi:hypothetical protein N1030_06075 [Desulfovibrio mangrovi]|uniref:hypothetical protein n=1 Tax=Desulfovibrio mangrovi TaxID=2976983 RepID=UPI0022460056|nr:hypothetical protein [Desulfovibrio mangrovi]UZP68536.1 hypothetical protein N1030_06075 [Desulfovibrio mangrovi]